MLPTALPLALSVSAVTLASFVHTDAIELKFAPEDGSTRTAAITVVTAQSGGDLAVTMGGVEVPQEYLPDLTFDVEHESKMVIVDRFTAPPKGAPGPWRSRTIDDASTTFGMDLDMGDEAGGLTTIESQASSLLEGAEFSIGVGADGVTVARWADEDHPDDALLEGLRVDLDLAGLLPQKAIEIGASWEASAAALRDVMEPSGDLGWEWSGGGAEEMGAWVSSELEGTLELTLQSVETLDGVRVARVDFDGTLVETRTRATDLEHVPVADGDATEVTTLSYTLEGELVWNLDANRAHSMKLEGEGEGDQIITRDPDQPGVSYESSTSLGSKFKLDMTCS